VDRKPRSNTYDREIDDARDGVRNYPEPIHLYRRLVANPLLGVADCAFAVLLIRYALEHRVLALFIFGIVLMPGVLFFSQFHCLDCGATGWLLAGRRHICPRLLVRWHEGRPSPWPFPGLKTQMILWLYVLASVAGLLLILFALSN
jgi:hypothetical protein